MTCKMIFIVESKDGQKTFDQCDQSWQNFTIFDNFLSLAFLFGGGAGVHVLVFDKIYNLHWQISMLLGKF